MLDDITEARLRALVAGHLGFSDNLGKVVSEASFRDDLGADSIDIVEVAMAIEDDLHIALTDDEIAAAMGDGTFGSLCELDGRRHLRQSLRARRQQAGEGFGMNHLSRQRQHAAEAIRQVLSFSELKPDGHEDERSRREVGYASSERQGIARCTPLLAGGLQCGERAAAAFRNRTHDLTESSAAPNYAGGGAVNAALASTAEAV